MDAKPKIGPCSKIDPPFVTFSVIFTYVEIWYVYDSAEKTRKKMLSIDISHLYGGYVEIEKNQAQVWANLEAN